MSRGGEDTQGGRGPLTRRLPLYKVFPSTAGPHPRDTVCGMDESSLSMKVVGRRRAPKRRDLSYAAPLLDLAVRLRGRRPFIPKGVHVFRSFEEADQWSLRMMTRPSRDRRP